MKFILFDIDGTLVDTGGAGIRSLNSSFEEIFSIRDAFRTVSMAGKTDPQIMREGMKIHNIDHAMNGGIPEFCRTYIRHLRHHIQNTAGHVKNGVHEILETLSSRENCVLGLLTGNIEEGAHIKLKHYGIDSYFSIGAFGNDDEDRNNLLPIAIEKLYRQRDLRLDFSDCAVIGDTPRDISCSKPYGALAVAVATGPYSYIALAEAGPDVLLHDLSDTAGLLSVLGMN